MVVSLVWLISVTVNGDIIELNAPGMDSITLPVNPAVTPDRLSKVTYVESKTSFLGVTGEQVKRLVTCS